MQFIQINVKELSLSLELMLPILVIRMFIKQWYQRIDRHSLGSHKPLKPGGRSANCKHSPFLLFSKSKLCPSQLCSNPPSVASLSSLAPSPADHTNLQPSSAHPIIQPQTTVGIPGKPLAKPAKEASRQDGDICSPFLSSKSDPQSPFQL